MHRLHEATSRSWGCRTRPRVLSCMPLWSDDHPSCEGRRWLGWAGSTTDSNISPGNASPKVSIADMHSTGNAIEDRGRCQVSREFEKRALDHRRIS